MHGRQVRGLQSARTLASARAHAKCAGCAMSARDAKCNLIRSFHCHSDIFRKDGNGNFKCIQSGRECEMMTENEQQQKLASHVTYGRTCHF